MESRPIFSACTRENKANVKIKNSIGIEGEKTAVQPSL
jgi:hypothetical protein